MPWDLTFPTDSLDARVEYRGILAQLREHPEVAELSELGRAFRHTATGHTATTVVRVFLRGEDGPRSTPPVQDRWLRELGFQHREIESPEPPWESRIHQVPYGEPNQNGDVFPRPNLPPLGLTREVQEGILSEYLRTSEGRTRLAQSMAAPLRRNLDYQSIARRTFLVEELPPGALPVYDRDPEVTPMVTAYRDPPLWVQVGAWGYCARTDEYFEVMERLSRGEVRIRPWRSSEVRTTDVDWLYERCEPCDQPADPRPIWERLLDEDAL